MCAHCAHAHIADAEEQTFGRREKFELSDRIEVENGGNICFGKSMTNNECNGYGGGDGGGGAGTHNKKLTINKPKRNVHTQWTFQFYIRKSTTFTTLLLCCWILIRIYEQQLMSCCCSCVGSMWCRDADADNDAIHF